MFGFRFLKFKHWASLKIGQPVAKLEGKLLKPVNFDVEHCLLSFFVLLGSCMRRHVGDDVGTILIFLIENGKSLTEISAYTIKYAFLLCKQRSWNANG